MFEFTEDRKSIRPKLIGTIKNNFIRRLLMVLATPPLIVVIIVLNVALFFIITTAVIGKAFWRFILYGTYILFASLFTAKCWEHWHKPREK